MAAENMADIRARFEEMSRARAEDEAAKEFTLISDVILPASISSVPVRSVIPTSQLPHVEDFKNIKIAYVFGPLGDVDAAIRLAGTMQLAQERHGTKIVFAYAKHLGNPDLAFLKKLGIWTPTGGPEQFIESTDEAFDAYFTEYSVGADEWFDHDLRDHADVLGRIAYSPVAFRTRGARRSCTSCRTTCRSRRSLTPCSAACTRPS